MHSSLLFALLPVAAQGAREHDGVGRQGASSQQKDLPGKSGDFLCVYSSRYVCGYVCVRTLLQALRH